MTIMLKKGFKLLFLKTYLSVYFHVQYLMTQLVVVYERNLEQK